MTDPEDGGGVDARTRTLGELVRVSVAGPGPGSPPGASPESVARSTDQAAA
jgi:hypothetical protein